MLNKEDPHDQPTEQCSTEYSEAAQGGYAEAEQGGDAEAEQGGDAEAKQGGDEDKGSMREKREEERVGGEEKKRKRPLPKIEPLFPENFLCFLPHKTCNAPKVSCTCRWCKIGRLNGRNLKKWVFEAKKSREGKPVVHTIYSKCGRGLQLSQKSHKCSSSDLSTVSTMLEQIPSSIKPKLTSALLKELADGGEHALQLSYATGGKPLSVQLGKQKAPETLSELTHDEMITMSSKHHLTGKQ